MTRARRRNAHQTADVGSGTTNEASGYLRPSEHVSTRHRGVYAFRLPYPPTANTYWRVWRGRAVKSTQARAYQARACLEAKRQLGVGQRGRPLQGPVAVVVALFRPSKRGDLDNSLKVLLDALKGVAFVDDAQVVSIFAQRHDDKANPRAEVEVREVEVTK